MPFGFLGGMFLLMIFLDFIFEDRDIKRLGQDARSTNRALCYLDTNALLSSRGQVLGDEWFVFYNQLWSPEGSMVHTRDYLIGEGGGHNELILIDVGQVPARSDKIVRSRSTWLTSAVRAGCRPRAKTWSPEGC